MNACGGELLACLNQLDFVNKTRMADDSLPNSQSPDSPPPRTTGGNWRWEPPSAEELQALMPGYTIEKLLGRGGMGAVYRGVQTNLDRPVAIKILPPGVEKEDPSFAERFKNEAKVMAKLMHPAVVAVFDFGQTSAGQLYFVMEYVDGTDVSRMIASQGRLPPEHALAITAHVCDALQAAHELGIVHRDIKPANVLLNQKGQVKVADFGLAKIEEPGQHGLTKTGYAMGTPDFVAPEALMLGTQVDGRADLYAVGVMLYQMLTGIIPRGAFKPASVLVPGLDPRFDAIIMKAMQHDRAERHQSAVEMRQELDVILTVPFIRQNTPESAAIPVSQVARVPEQRSAVQKPVGGAHRGAAVSPANSPARTLASAPTVRSKTSIFIGIAAVLAIGAGAFLMMGGKKDAKAGGPVASTNSSSNAAPAAKSPPKETPVVQTISSPVKLDTTSTSPSSGSIPSSAAASPVKAPLPRGQWVKACTSFDDYPVHLHKPESGFTWEDGVLRGTSKSLYLGARPFPNKTKNMGLRGTFAGEFFTVIVRDDDNRRYFSITERAIAVWDENHPVNLPGNTRLQAYTPPKPDQRHAWEFAAVADRVVVKRDGKVLADVQDNQVRPGDVSVRTLVGTLSDIEVIDLDGLSESEAWAKLGMDEKGGATVANRVDAPPSAARGSAMTNAEKPSAPPSAALAGESAPPAEKFPPGQWVKVLTRTEELPSGLRKPDSGVTLDNGVLEVTKKGAYVGFEPATGPLKNCGFRAVIKASSFIVRLRDSVSELFYAFWQESIRIQGRGEFTVPENAQRLAPYAILGKAGEVEGRWEFYAIGNRLIARFEDHILASVTDDRLATGKIVLANLLGTMRDIEVINLDGIPETEALQIAGVDAKGTDTRAAALAAQSRVKAQAKQADTIATIPELKALNEQFVKLQADRVTAPFQADLAKLNAGYLGGLDRKIADEKKAGHLDNVLALEAEKKLIQGSGGVEAFAPCPLPEDDDKTPAALKGLRQIYRESYAKLETSRAANLKALTDPLTVRLKQLESTLTQQNRVPDAQAVREYASALGNTVAAPAATSPVPARTANATGESKPAAASAKAGKIAKPQNAFSEREAAEWALSFLNGGGGTYVTIWQPNKGEQRIQSLALLPKEKFTVRVVQVTPVAGPEQDRVTDQDVTRLLGLEEVKRIALTGTKLTGQALRALAQIPTLEELNFPGKGLDGLDLSGLEGSPVNQLTLTGLTVKDPAALKVLTTLKNLRFLSISETLSVAAVTAFPSLPKLEVLSSTINREITDEALPLIPAKAPALQRLDLWGATNQGTKITGSTLGSLKGLKDLNDLGLNFTQIDDVSLKPLTEFKSLKKLSLAGTKVTDACIPTLKGIKNLDYLAIFVSQITDAGLMELAQIRSLKTLKVRHTDSPPIGPPSTGFTEAGIAAFEKKRPDVKIER